MSKPNVQLDTLRNDVDRLALQLPQAGSQDEALQIAIEAAETSMRLMSLVTDRTERERTASSARSWMSQAERIKTSTDWRREVQATQPVPASPMPQASTPDASKFKLLKEPQNSRSLSTAEQIIVLKGGFLNSVKFPQWTALPGANEFQLKDGEELFFDEASELPLSDFQLDVLDDWKRPQDALPPPAWFPETHTDHGPLMTHAREVDLVQDAATDCSVVASLCAILARFKHGFPPILSDTFYPCDVRTKDPVLSQNGKYILRMNFNGCYRRVVIDDRIPTSLSSRVVHVVDRNNPSLLWPALVEKAYLKVRGGYDFPGSNSATDLWVLTGWIPEQVFLQSDDLEPDRCWKRVFSAFSYGDVLITLGTGTMSTKTERALGLAGEHDYAVLDLREVDGQCLALVKNPWCQGTSWRGRFKRTREPGVQVADGEAEEETDDFGDELEPVNSPRDLLNIDDQLSPGTFWMDLDNVLQHFESMYLNWNTGLFSYRQDIHFHWDLSEPADAGRVKPRGPYASLQNTPQYTVSAEKGGTIWVLLWRHFQNFVPENATPEEIESGRQHIDLTGHISIIAFASGGRRVMLPERYVKKVWFVDSPQTLLKLEDCDPGRPYTIAPLEQELSPTNQSFTISAFSNSPMTMGPALSRHAYSERHSAAWTKDTAGGNAQHSTYCDNPQFSLTVTGKTKVSILLESSSSELNVHVKLLHSNGQRVYRIRNKDIIVDSKDYRRGCCLAESDELEDGQYTIICSTFEPSQLGDFTLLVESSQRTYVSQLPREGAGRVRTLLEPARFRHGESKVAVAIVPQRLVNLYALARAVEGVARPHAGRSHVRLSIEAGRAYERDVLVVSNGGDFSDSNASLVRTAAIDMGIPESRRLGVTECWLVLERMYAGSDSAEEQFQVEIYADQPNGFVCGPWTVLEE